MFFINTDICSPYICIIGSLTTIDFEGLETCKWPKLFGSYLPTVVTATVVYTGVVTAGVVTGGVVAAAVVVGAGVVVTERCV